MIEALSRFRRGASFALSGLRYVYRDHPSLARFYVWPVLITAGSIVFAIRHVVRNHAAWAEAIWPSPASGEEWGALARFLHGGFEWILLGLGALLSLILAALFASIVAAPFNDALSEAVEELETGRAGPAFSLGGLARDVLRTVAVEAGKIAIFLSVMGPLFVASYLVPVVGQLAYTAFGVLFTASYFAIDYVDWPASRRGLGFKERLAFLRRHRASMLGFGGGVWVLLFIPLVNLLFMPAAVAGGTRLFLELEEEEKMRLGP